MKQQVNKAVAEAEDAGGPPTARDDSIAQPATEERGNGRGGESGSIDGGGAPLMLLTAIQASTDLAGESHGNTGAMFSGGASDGGQCPAILVAHVQASYLRDNNSEDE